MAAALAQCSGDLYQLREGVVGGLSVRVGLLASALALAMLFTGCAILGFERTTIKAPSGREYSVPIYFSGSLNAYYYIDPETGEEVDVDPGPQGFRARRPGYRPPLGSVGQPALPPGEVFTPPPSPRQTLEVAGTPPGMPGGLCWGAVPGQTLVARDPNPNVQLALERECVGGNGSGARQ